MKFFKSIREQRDNEMEKAEMAEQQLHFICYAVDEILEYVQEGGEIEEWYQNKLSKVHSDVEGLYSYVQGEKHRMENDDDDDDDDDDDMMGSVYR